jgi:sec-independent protein translocase protein TatC
MSEAPVVGEMPLLEHLRELRNRVIKAGVVLLICVAICMAFSNDLIDFLAAPIRQVLDGELAGKPPERPMDVLYVWLTTPLQSVPGWTMLTDGSAPGKLTIRGSLEGIYTYMRVGFLGGAFMASPVLAFQMWRFVGPGLYKTEQKVVMPLTFFSTLLFFLGAGFAYFIILPIAFRFFVTVVEAEALLSIDDALRTVVRIVVAFGLCYQLPVVVWFFARIGLIDHKDMIKGFRYAIVGIFGIAALLTPPDVLTQFLLGIPLVLLYAVGIVVAFFTSRKEREIETTSEET